MVRRIQVGVVNQPVQSVLILCLYKVRHASFFLKYPNRENVEMNVAANPSEKTSTTYISINEHDYYLDKIPAGDSPLVQKYRSSVLKDMELDTVYNNLKRTADLIKLAYVSVAGYDRGKLQAKMSGLQKDMLDLTKDCSVTMGKLQASSEEVLKNISSTYKWLLKGNEKMALSQLMRCQEQANSMVSACQVLIDRTSKLSDQAEKIKQDAILEQGFQKEKSDELEKIIAEAESQKKVALEAQQQLIESVKNINELYGDAKKREEKASEREMITNIVGGLTQAISAGVGAYNGGARNLPDNEQDTSKADKEKLESSKKEVDKVQKELDNVTADMKKSQKALDELNSKQPDLDKKNETAKVELKKAENELAEVKEAKSESASAKLEAAEAKVEEAKKGFNKAKLELEDQKTKTEQTNSRLEKEKKEAKEKEAALKGVQASLDSLTKSLEKMSDQARSERQSISEEKMRLLEEKFKLEDQKRTAITDVIKYTEKLKNSQFQHNYAETAVYSLALAIKALAQIVTALSQMNLFWSSMGEYCQRLSKSEFKALIEDLMENMDKEDRIEYYSDDEFKEVGISDIAKWKALSVICEEYQKASMETYGVVTNNIDEAPSIEEARQQVTAVANDVLSEAQVDIDAQQKRLESIRLQQEEYRKAS
ncbi:hypothetical protein L4C34_13295 [Vibrio profundum]|uniref:hypothetical protein n=1 Tax=Vibrio profundum TaxID=2910247 RepID=UPI003D105E7D